MAANDSDDEGPTLNFDPLLPGSVALSGPIENCDGDPFQFQSFQGALKKVSKHPKLLEDMKQAFTSTNLEESEDSDDDNEKNDEKEAKEYGVSSGDTFWVYAEQQKKTEDGYCNLETLALEIFNFHCKRLGLVADVHYDPKTSGAEWWTQYIEGDAEIGLHWDKDFTFESYANMDLFPHLGTVTYLTGSDGGQAPTLILDHTPSKVICGSLPEEEDENMDDNVEKKTSSSSSSSGSSSGNTSSDGRYDFCGDDSEWLCHSKQKGVIRTNCIDCLDRTNVVQAVIAKYMLKKQSKALQFNGDKNNDEEEDDEDRNLESDEQDDDDDGEEEEEEDDDDYEEDDAKVSLKTFKKQNRDLKSIIEINLDKCFRDAWSENADVMATLYAGSGAMKTDFIRTGKRTLVGATRDVISASKRYILNHFLDPRRQTGIDFLLNGSRDPNQLSESAQVVKLAAGKKNMILLVIKGLLAALTLNLLTSIKE